MTKHISRIIAFLAIAGLAAGLTGCCSMLKYCKDQILIINQPESQTVRIGSNVTFSVFAVKGPPWTTNGLSYQWQFNGTLLSGNLYWTNLTILGATNSSITITNAQIANVGFYRVLVSGSPTVPSEPASLQVFTATTGAVTVFGTPVATTGTKGSCPGSFKGYINYTNNPPAWGWAVTDRLVKATAANGGAYLSSNTRVEYLGLEAFDTGCAAGTVDILANSTVPPPAVPPSHTPSSRYQFTIYFKKLPLPTGAYPINLTNFDP